MNKKILTLLVTSALVGGTHAQIVNISDGAVAACSGTLVDSGGDAGAGYGPNENFTLIVCSDQTNGTGIRLNFSSWTLPTESGNPEGWDRLSVHDGPDASFPLIGQFTWGSVPTQISSSFDNTLGCLTLVWSSNAASHGGFSASISCFTPCEPPVALGTANTGIPPINICPGDAVSFDGSASYAAQGFGLASWSWDFRDGSPLGTGETTSHVYTTPGEFAVGLVVTDNNDCESTNVPDIRVRVSTVADFDGTTLSDDQVCVGETVDLSGVVISPTWTNTPVPFIEGETSLPDGSGVTYTSEMTVGGFPATTVIEDCDDVIEVCLVMEHSFVGDLIVRMTSPSGASVLLFDGNPAGGTYLGNTIDATDGTPGEGWLYCFQNTGELGTLVSEINSGNVVQAGTPPYNTAVPGHYTSQESFCAWQGSGLNGIWTLSILDDAFIDDGTIFEWYMSFDPELYPDAITFTPSIGAGADSSSWSGPGLSNVDVNGDLATFTPSAVGSYDFTYTATNSFGCTFDTTFTVNVVQGIPSPLYITGSNTACAGAVTQLSAPPGYTSYSWNNGFLGANISALPGTYTVTVFSGDCSLESEPFTITAIPAPALPEITGPEGVICGGTPAVLSTTTPYAQYAWSNGETSPSTSVSTTGSYTVTVTENGCSVTSAPFPVQIGSTPQAAILSDLTSPQGIGTTVNFSGSGSQGNGSPLTNYTWDFGIPGAGAVGQNASYTFAQPGSFGVQLTVTAVDNCEHSTLYNFVILPEEIIIPNVFTPNGDNINEFFEIENGQFFTNELSVYDRWGKQVFSTKNYRNTWRATDVADGTYYYVFRTVDDGKEYTGHVTILR